MDPRSAAQSWQGAVFLAPDCPARGHRVNGGPTSPFIGVTTSDDVIVAQRRLEALSPEIVAAQKAMTRTTVIGPVTSIKAVPFPTPLARQMRQIDADLAAFGAARVRYRPHKSPQAIGDAAQKLMRDIPVVRATCSRARIRAQS
jgi:hypothetical protein